MSVEKTKRDYAALLAKRATANTRRLYKLPLCLDPTLYAERDAAREALREAEKEDAAQRARGTSPRAKMADVNPLAAAKTRLEAAEDAIRDVSIVLVVAGRTSDETVRVIKSQAVIEVPDDATPEQKADAQANQTFQLNRALFMDAPAAIEAAPVVAAILADELGWSAARTAESTEAFRRVAEGFL